MSYVVTQTCCSDASCVAVCPVNCIHPAPGEPDFGRSEMLYIDPRTCIDCGACADACPVDAIVPVDQLTEQTSVFADLNREYFRDRPAAGAALPLTYPTSLPRELGRLRVAIVGTGPAAWYTADLLLRSAGAEVTMIDRLPVPGGLLRYGVAPDHGATKGLGDSFSALHNHPRLNMLLNVEVGRHISVAELAQHHHAVVYAVGASTDRSLGIAGEQLTGAFSATDFVAWYNGHPDAADISPDLSAERAVVIGNGNVALDVARILVRDAEDLANTDIADHALSALRRSAVREVVVLGRRGPDEASFTRSELIGLRNLPGVDVVTEDQGLDLAGTRVEALTAVSIDWAAPPPAGRRIVFRFQSAPVRIDGDDAVDEITVTDPVGELPIPTGLVLKAVGYRGRPIGGLPFDAATSTVPHDSGRVGAGAYVVGWIKRGPTGGIGANRPDAADTVATLLSDAAAGRLIAPIRAAGSFERLVRRRQPNVVTTRQVLAIDRAERARATGTDRPRVKFVTIDQMLKARR